MAQIARPDSDISLGSWSPYPVDPTTLFDKIDEETPNGDTDYIWSDLDEDVCEVAISVTVDPGVGTNHFIRCWAYSSNGSGAKEKLDIALVENGNVRAQGIQTIVSRTGYALIEHALSVAEANSIQNYGNLRLRFHVCVVNSNEPLRVTQAEFECPDAVEEHAGVVAISGNGSIAGIAKKGGKQSSLISAKGALVAIGIVAMLGVASVPGGGTIASIGKKVAQADTIISGGGELATSGTKAEGEPHSGSAAISGNGTIAVQDEKGAEEIAEITGNGSIIAAGTKQEGEEHSGVAIVSGNGVLAGIAIKQASGDLVITGNGILSGAGTKQAPGDSTIVGGGSIVAVGVLSESHYGVVIISGNGVLHGAGIKQVPGNLVIIGGGSIVATGYGLEVLIEIVKTVLLESKFLDRVQELKSTIKPSIVLNSEIKPEGES